MKKLFLLITILSLLAIIPIVSAAVDYTENYKPSIDVLIDQDFQNQAELILNLLWILVVVSIIELILKGFAMWKACKKNSMAWFWIILILNTAGILPLIYLLVTWKLDQKKPNKKTKKRKKKRR
jgi:uncharacterized membrane protein